MCLSISSYASDYGSMYISNASTNLISTSLTAGTELQLTGYSTMENSGFTNTTNQLKLNGVSGKFMFRFSLSFTASEGLWDIIVKKNGIVESQIIGKRKIGASNTDIGNVAITGLMDISTNDIITIYVKSSASATSFTPIHSQVMLIPIEMTGSPNVGEMTISNNSSSQSLTSSWADLSGFSVGKNINGFNYVSNTLETASDGEGYYYVSLSVSFKTTAGAISSDYDFGIATNNGTPSTMLMERNLSGAADRGNAVLCGIIHLNDNDVVHVKVKNALSQEVVVQYSNLVVTSLDLVSTGSYGNMYMSGNSSAIAITDGAWTQEPNFSAASNNLDWSVSSGKLVPSINAVGFYLLSFNCAVTYKGTDDAGTYIYPLGSVFINGIEQTNITIERKLQKKDNFDYGSLSGSGFVIIDDVSDVIEFMYKSNGSGNKNILTKDANLNLVKLSTTVNLPINLISFNALLKNDFVKLEWVTASEDNNSFFEIQSSSDGKCFNNIGKVKGAGSSNCIINYCYNDTRKVNDVIYYRLKQVDSDGKFSYSKIVYVDSRNEKTQLLSQNINENIMNLNIKSTEDQNVKMQLYTINGQLVKTKNMSILKGSNEYKVVVNNLLVGVYMLRLLSENLNINKKIIKN